MKRLASCTIIRKYSEYGCTPLGHIALMRRSMRRRSRRRKKEKVKKKEKEKEQEHEQE